MGSAIFNSEAKFYTNLATWYLLGVGKANDASVKEAIGVLYRGTFQRPKMEKGFCQFLLLYKPVQHQPQRTPCPESYFKLAVDTCNIRYD